MRRTRKGGIAIVTAIVCILFACGHINDDELLCEEAVARLEDCCPRFDVRVFNCREYQGCYDSVSPDLTTKASNCVREKSCEELVAQGLCESLTQLALGGSPTFSPNGTANPRTLETEACR
jgi:hypothetical protein